MDDVLKRIMYFEKINEIYSNKLFTIKSIAQHLDLWDSLSVDEKNQLEKITIADSLINGHKDEYLSKLENFDYEDLGYGEVTKSGADDIFNYIKKNIGINFLIGRLNEKNKLVVNTLIRLLKVSIYLINIYWNFWTEMKITMFLISKKDFL